MRFARRTIEHGIRGRRANVLASVLVTLGTVTFSRTAAADEPAPPEAPNLDRCDRVGPRNAISTQPLAFFARGVALAYERLVVPRVSVVGIAGYRSAAQGDYSSNTIHGGVEGRVWFRPQVDIKCGMSAMSGPYGSVRMGVGYTRLVDELANDRTVGSSVAFTPTLNLGWRFVAYRRIEVTPSLGAGLRADVDPPSGLVSTPRAILALNLTVGWMF